MTVRVRFAPSPTGNLHFGNLRAALFNWLFARHEKGQFLLRLEDTDLARSTPEAIENVYDSLRWAQLDWDEEPIFQTHKLKSHQAAAEKLMARGHAYRATPVSAWAEQAAQQAAAEKAPAFAQFLAGFRADIDARYAKHKVEFEARELEKKPSKRREYRAPLALGATAEASAAPAVFFRMPFDIGGSKYAVESDEVVTLQVHPRWPVLVHWNGLEYAPRFERHTGDEPYEALAFDIQQRSLAGFPTLEALDKDGQVLYALAQDLPAIQSGAIRVLEGVYTLRSKRRFAQFTDLIKGVLKKPFDSLKNRLILRSDNTPVFHLANVVDDVDSKITHILRGDDHVDNSFWHPFLFEGLGEKPPQYGHLPMIVNAEGKPYSKRDGDVDVASFRDQGILPEAFINYMALLGWSPGDNREKMSRDEIVQAFTLDRIGDTAAQFDAVKLANLNGQYLRELALTDLVERVKPFLVKALGKEKVDALDPVWLEAFVKIEQERLTRLNEIVTEKSRYFFEENITVQRDDKRVRKILEDGKTPQILEATLQALQSLGDFQVGRSGRPVAELAPLCESKIKDVAEKLGLGLKDVGPVLRVALTGGLVSPPIGELCALVGSKNVIARLLGFLPRSATSEPLPHRIVFNGIVHPARANVALSQTLPNGETKPVMVAMVGSNGLKLVLKIIISLSTVTVVVETNKSFNSGDEPKDLRNLVRDHVQSMVDIIGYTRGCGYWVEIVSYQDSRSDIPSTFGVNIPIVEQSTKQAGITDDLVFKLLGTGNTALNIQLPLILSNLRQAIYNSNDTPFHCNRALECIRKYYIKAYGMDEENKDKSWECMRTELGLTKEDLNFAKEFAEESRHGGSVQYSALQSAQFFEKTWQIVNIFMASLIKKTNQETSKGE